MIISDKAAAIAPYVAGEQPQDKKYIKLNTNENPYPPSPNVASALCTVNVNDLRLYPCPDSTALKRAIAVAEGVSEENIFVGNGSDEVLSLAFLALFNSNANPVLFADVTYSFYTVFCSLYNINYKLLPLDSSYNIVPSDYIAQPCSGIVIANPNAPTSILLHRNKIETILAQNPQTAVIVDEAYIDFAPGGSSTVPLVAKYNNLLCVKTFSKSYSLAGLRCGYAVGSTLIIEALNKIKDCFNSYPIDRICGVLAAASISDRAYFDKAVSDVLASRDSAIKQLITAGYTVAKSAANFLFVTVKSGNAKSVYLALKQKGILVRYFDKPRLTDKLRVTVGTAKQTDAFVSALIEIEQTDKKI